MPITVADVLRQSGMTEDAIKALDANAIKAFETVVTSATAAQEKAELAQRAQREMYDRDIAPALDQWGNDKARLEAEAAFYRTQAEAAKSGGFIPSDAPTFKAGEPARGGDGKFVPGANAVPGSPDVVRQMRTEIAGAFSEGLWAMQEYQRVTGGQYLPDDVVALSQEATAQRMPFKDYVAKKYDFAGKRAVIAAAEKKKEHDAIRAEVAAEKDREWAEKSGNNPNFRTPESSRFSKLDAAVKEGQRKDPLTMTREQRHVATRQEIHKDVNENAAVA